MPKQVTAFESRHGSLVKDKRVAIEQIIAGCGLGEVSAALGDNGDVEVNRLRDAILEAAQIIKSRKNPTNR